MFYRRYRILLAACAMALAGCANLPSADKLGVGGTYVVNMPLDADGYRRSYRVHIPAGYRPAQPAPLVVVVHGAFSTARDMEEETGFSQLADKEGFVVAYPDGIGILGFLQHWNAGHCCGKAAADGVDDVGFIADIIEHVTGYASIDDSRVYMVGFSNGAMLTHRFAAERTELLAAAASLAGAIDSADNSSEPGWQMPAAGSSLPIIMFHGLQDERIPYGEAHADGTSRLRGYSTVADASRYWWSRNGCDQHHRSDVAANAGISIDTWSGCHENVSVQLFTLTEWGHRWPGPYFTDRVEPRDDLHGFDAATIIWSFFQSHRRDDRDV